MKKQEPKNNAKTVEEIITKKDEIFCVGFEAQNTQKRVLRGNQAKNSGGVHLYIEEIFKWRLTKQDEAFQNFEG